MTVLEKRNTRKWLIDQVIMTHHCADADHDKGFWVVYDHDVSDKRYKLTLVIEEVKKDV